MPNSLRWTAVWLAAAGATLPAPTTSANEPGLGRSTALRTADVALAPGGVLAGQVVDTDGRPQASQDVLICRDERVLATTTTDVDGRFQVSGLRGGAVQLVTPHTTRSCRLWTPGTHPPSAQPAILLVNGIDAQRGQWGPPTRLNRIVRGGTILMTNPWFAGGLLTTAVAVPVIMHNVSQDDQPAS